MGVDASGNESESEKLKKSEKGESEKGEREKREEKKTEREDEGEGSGWLNGGFVHEEKIHLIKDYREKFLLFLKEGGKKEKKEKKKKKNEKGEILL